MFNRCLLSLNRKIWWHIHLSQHSDITDCVILSVGLSSRPALRWEMLATYVIGEMKSLMPYTDEKPPPLRGIALNLCRNKYVIDQFSAVHILHLWSFSKLKWHTIGNLTIVRLTVQSKRWESEFLIKSLVYSHVYGSDTSLPDWEGNQASDE